MQNFAERNGAQTRAGIVQAQKFEKKVARRKKSVNFGFRPFVGLSQWSAKWIKRED